MAKKKKEDKKYETQAESFAEQNDAVREDAAEVADDDKPDMHEPSDIDLKDELTLAREALNEMNDKYLRLYSEFDNYRKRTLRERAELIQTAASGLITQLLPVLDDFERAERSFDNAKDITALREGVDLIHNKFRKILEQKGLEEIKAVGEEFNTDIHEAVTNIPAESEEMRGKVVDEIEKGYTLNGTVIRFARVAVAN